MRPRENEAKIAAVQAVAWRRLGVAGRMRVAADMSDDTRRVHADKIRRSNPSYSEDEVKRALAKELYGEVSPSERRTTASSISLEDALARLLNVLDVAHVPFMLTGSLASTAHGVPRATMDLDVVIDPPAVSADVLLATLADAGWIVDGGETAARQALAARSHFVIVDEVTAWKVDLVVRRDRPFSVSEFARRELLDVLGVRAWVASAEDTIVAKLEHAMRAGDATRRAQQRRDIAGVISSRGAELDRTYLEHWVAELGLEHEWHQAASARP